MSDLQAYLNKLVDLARKHRKGEPAKHKTTILMSDRLAAEETMQRLF
jgi:hypothetical protein